MSSAPPSPALTTPVNVYRSSSYPVDPNWACQHSGDCCEKIAEVVLTRQEWEAVKPRVPEGVSVVLRDVDAKFLAIKAGPCPLHIFNRCTVYDVRPYNCRRFACLRPDPASEPFEAMGWDVRVKVSRAARRMLATYQRKAQRWAVQHGWK